MNKNDNVRVCTMKVKYVYYIVNNKAIMTEAPNRRAPPTRNANHLLGIWNTKLELHRAKANEPIICSRLIERQNEDKNPTESTTLFHNL